jgi:hypothetical protein
MRVSVRIGVLLSLVFGVGLVSPTLAQRNAAPARPTKEEWRRDLRYFATELPKRHKNLFHSTSREAFDRAVAELDAATTRSRSTVSSSTCDRTAAVTSSSGART